LRISRLWVVFICLLLAACQPAQSPTQPPTITSVPPTPSQSNSWDDLSIFTDGLIPAEQARLNEQKGDSVYHIDYTISDDFTSVTGQETVHYTNRENIVLDEIQVHLLPNVLGGEMSVSSVLVDDQPVDPSYGLENSLLRIALDPGLPAGESVDLSFEFSVKVPTEIETNYGILAYYDGVLTLAHTYPMIAVYDEHGWNAEIPSDQGDPTYADVSFFLVTVDAPAQVVLVGSGREVKHENNGIRQIVTFAAGPARDFYVVASPDYEKVSQTVGEVTFNSYAPETMQAGAKTALSVAIEAFKLYDERYAPYPYTEFDIVSTPTYALGIEYPGVIAITDRIYDIGGTLSGSPNSIMMEATVAHEAGHQWFYNLVGNNQLDEPWLDESLTQFVTWQYFADRYGSSGANGFEQSLRSRWGGVDNQAIPIGLPVADYEGAAYGAIIYGRGPFFFDALRNEMGVDTFNAFMKDYTTNNGWGISTTDSMKQLAERDCNCDLSALFKEWVYP
jgi:aminopeptidase N